MRRDFEIVVAMDKAGGIGKDNAIPWRLKGDMQQFRTLTTTAKPSFQNAVIMGRKTWESLPEKFRPLPGRLNVVLTRNPGYILPAGVVLATGLDLALENLAGRTDIDRVFVIGGGELYKEALQHANCGSLHVTKVMETFPADTSFPKIPTHFRPSYASNFYVENGLAYGFFSYER